MRDEEKIFCFRNAMRPVRMLFALVATVALTFSFSLTACGETNPEPVARVPLETTPNPNALPAAKARKAGVSTPRESDETLSRLLRMRSRLKNLQVDTHWLDGQEITRRFTATMGRGRLVGVGRINWSLPDEQQWAVVEVFDADVAEFLHVCDVRFDGKIDARVTGKLRLEWRGMRFYQMRATMTGSGTLAMSEGQVGSTRLLDNIARFSGIDDIRTLQFQRGLVEGTIANGKVLVKKFELEGQDFWLGGTGSVVLETGELDARFQIKVKPALARRSRFPEVRAAGDALSKLAGGENRFLTVPLPVSFGGNLERPIPYLDLPSARAVQSGVRFLEGVLTTSTQGRRARVR